MYHLKKIIDHDMDIQCNTNMYKMRPLFKIEAPSTDSEEVAVLKEVLRQQEVILEELKSLKTSLEKIKTDKGACEIKTTAPTESRSLVVNANPELPPYSLLLMKDIWKDQILVSTYKHSSVEELPKKAQDFSNRLLPPERIANKPPMKIDLIWKKGLKDTEINAYPFLSVPLLGEANLIRYLFRMFGQELKNEDQRILDLCYQLDAASLKTEAKSYTSQLNNLLGKNDFFCNSKVSPANVAASSALCRTAQENLSASLKKYLQRCS